MVLVLVLLGVSPALGGTFINFSSAERFQISSKVPKVVFLLLLGTRQLNIIGRANFMIAIWEICTVIFSKNPYALKVLCTL